MLSVNSLASGVRPSRCPSVMLRGRSKYTQVLEKSSKAKRSLNIHPNVCSMVAYIDVSPNWQKKESRATTLLSFVVRR